MTSPASHVAVLNICKYTENLVVGEWGYEAPSLVPLLAGCLPLNKAPWQ